MPRYVVTWTIDVFDAESPRAAAQEAFEIMQTPDTSATCFQVVDEAGEQTEIDLEDDNG